MSSRLTPSKRLIILGHSGFIGSRLLSAFQAADPALEIRTPPRLDLSKEEEAMRLADWISADSIVILCAAVKKQLGDNLDSFTANLRITENLCRLLVKAPPARLIYFSSAAVYGEDTTNLAINEQTPINPSTYYGIGKYASENLLRKTVEQLPTSLLILRPPLIYGSGDKSKGYGPTGFIWNALHGKGQITLWGEGNELREFVYIEDVVRIAYDLTWHDYAGTVNIATGTSHSFLEAANYVSKLLPVTITSRPRTKAKVDLAFRNDHLRMLLPSLEFTSLHDGISQTLAELSNEEPA